MAPTQRKIDFPVRKTRSSFHKEVSKPEPVKNKSDSIENNENCQPKTLKTPIKRKKENDSPISLSPPSKKARRNISVYEKPLQDNKVCSPVKFVKEVSVYQKAKHLLNTACPEKILGRENEIQQLSSFLDEHLCKKKAGSLYISGPPGTGKTACLTHLLKALDAKMKFKSIYINCMTVKQSQGIFSKISTELNSKCKKSGKQSRSCLEKTFTTSGPMVLLVLDEIDHLDSKNQEVLYSIYEWATLKNSRLVLVGVANALDLTDRILPRLKACRVFPQLCNFAPYSKDQIQAIIHDRISDITHNGQSVFKPIAIQFCARKVSACAGDIRKALDVCRRAIDIVEADIRRPALKSTHNEGRAENSPKKLKTSNEFKPVDLSQVSSVLRSIYDSRIISSDQSFSQTFPLQQKVIIGTLLLMAKKGKDKEVAIGKVHEVYSRVCKKRQISEISQSEFNSLCNLIESRGIVSIKSHKEKRLSKINLKIDENEVEHVLQDQNLLGSILNDDSCLKK